MKHIGRNASWLAAAAAGLGGGSAAAHHSWSAEYDLSRSAYVSGTVTRIAIRHPHSALVLIVNTEDGRQEHWTVEWASPQRLRDRGVTDKTLRVGDALFVTGNPHRDAKVKSLRAVSVRRGDGSEIGGGGAARG
jgi:hypothetical protein